MNKHQKVWTISASIFILICFGFLIWAVATTDRHEIIDQTIQSSDTTNVTSITIVPYNPNWIINLTEETLVVNDNHVINDFLVSFKRLSEKSYKKGTKTFWNAYLIVSYDKKVSSKLRDPTKLIFHVYNTEAGLFVDRQNVMGNRHYSNNDLKDKLEKITGYSFSK
jgi:hypothetical protein